MDFFFTSVLLVVTLSCFSQIKYNNYYVLDREKDGVYGISLNRAYEYVESQQFKSKPVIVAVLDAGIDTLHEDLKSVLWKNLKEIPGNGKDDDLNGYMDDIYGWNFIGNKDGKNVNEDSYEPERIYYALGRKFSDATIDSAKLNDVELYQYRLWKEVEHRYKAILSEASCKELKTIVSSMKRNDTVLIRALGKKYTDHVQLIKDIEILTLLEESRKQFREFIPKKLRAEIVKDDEENINDRLYGNSDVMAGDPFHGTHVAGIIGAARNNGKGIDGIADNVKIMFIRIVPPKGDEHDKDVALAIRYAVDNGAQVINMSFGKEYSPHKKMVDEAMQYAAKKDVLLVHAAGNQGYNLDSTSTYPISKLTFPKGRAENFISVGASGDHRANCAIGYFSNYGSSEVDLFAPGIQIYSTIPGDKYGEASGTSMSAPVTAGCVAFLLSYFPNLSAKQLKYCLTRSAWSPGKVKKPGTETLVDMSELCASGGLLNLYEAAKIASTLKGDRKSRK